MINLLFLSFSFALTLSTPAIDPIWDSVVQIRTEAVDQDGADVPAYCNATLLSNQLLITAAHCVHHAQVLKSFTVHVEVGAYKFATRPDGSTVRIGYITKLKHQSPAQFYFTPAVTRSFVSSKFKAKIGPSEDMAMIVLTNNLDLPSDFPFAKIISQQNLQGLKNKITQYKPTVVTINFLEEMSTDTKRLAELNNLNLDKLHFTSKSNSRVQAGDSGAPLFARIGNEWNLVGVVKGRASTVFSNWDVYTSVESNLCLISEQFSPLCLR